MADYYPLIARAVASLEKNTGEARRALYERARTALVAQLRAVNPPLDESDITRERLSLEEAIRKVEAETARRPGVAQPRADVPQRPAEGARAEPPRAPAVGGPPPRAEPQRPPPPGSPRAMPPRPEPPPVEPSRRETPPRTDSPRAAPPRAEPPRSAPRPEPPEPIWDRPLGESRPASARTPPPRSDILRNLAGAAEPSSPRRRPTEERAAEWPIPEEFDRLEPQRPADAFEAPHEGALRERIEGFDEVRPTPRPRPARQDAEAEVEVLRRHRRVLSRPGLAKVAAMAGAVVVLGVLAWWQSANIAILIHGLRGVPAQTARDVPSPGGKIGDRVGQEAAPGQTARPSPAPPPPPAVAQRVVLYEEDPNDPQGSRFVGSAVWRTEQVVPAAGQPAQLAVRADVEIPERRMTMSMSIRRNLDQTLPASHTIEITFNIPADFAGGGIGNVPGILMKQAEQTRGVPLAGLAVKVTTGFFLIGLSAVESDVARNVQLLKERAWFDIPLVYSNNRRAILAIEKGTPGERAFEQAFATWERAATTAR